MLKEKKDIKAEVNRKKEILETKVKLIKEKIIEHNINLNENLKKTIENKLNEKLENLKNNEKFKFLKRETKQRVIEKTIIKVKIKINNLENEITKTVATMKKIEIYMIVLERLEKFKNELS